MPSAEEQIQFLYLLLTHGGAPTVFLTPPFQPPLYTDRLQIDWDSVCAALQLEKGAATKRWSRLKQAMEKNEDPAASSLDFLWILLKHTSRDKVINTIPYQLSNTTDFLQSYDWDAIAKSSGSTKGACSKRWSRLKLAFERGDAPPSTPSKSKSGPATPRKTPAKVTPKTNADGTPIATPKRKRTPAKKTADEGEDEEEDEADEKPKRAKGTPKTKPRPKNSFRASDDKDDHAAETVVKGEPAEDGDVFVDAPEEICKCASSLFLSLHRCCESNGADSLSAHVRLLRGVCSC